MRDRDAASADTRPFLAMFIPRFVLNLVTSQPNASFSLTPDGVVRFHTEKTKLHAFVPCLSEFLKVRGILTADASPGLQVQAVEPPFDVALGLSEVPVLRERMGTRAVAVLEFAPSAHQVDILFGLIPDAIALAHSDGVASAPDRLPAPPSAHTSRGTASQQSSSLSGPLFTAQSGD